MADQTQLQRLLHAVLLVSEDLDLEVVLRRIVEAGCSLVDAAYGALGVIDESGEALSAFVHHGIDARTANRIGSLPAGHGILGELIRQPSTLRLDRINDHPASYGFPKHHPPMESFLGTPIRIGDRVFGNLYLTEKRGGAAFTEADEQLVAGLAAVAGSVLNNARLFDTLQRREKWRDAIMELSTFTLSGASPGEAQDLIVSLASELVDGQVGCLVQYGRCGADGTHTYEVVGRCGDAAPPLGLLSMVGDPVRDCLANGVATRAEHAPIFGRATIWVPVRDDKDVVAAVGIGRTTPFTAAEEELLASFGNHASVVLAYGRAQRDLRRLSLVEERERIGRDLHDTVIQRLFATGLSLQATIRQVDDTPNVSERIVRAVDDIDRTVKEIRSTIFALQSKDEQTAQGVRSRLLAVADEMSPLLGTSPRIRFDGPLDTAISAAIADQLVPVLREALTNVAKHAQADEVSVDVELRDATVVLSVVDNGVGVDPASSPGFGVENLRRRARDRGGDCDMRAGNPQGTMMVWWVPV